MIPPTPRAQPAWLAPWAQRWAGLLPRERRGVLIAAVAIGLLVLWGGLLRPALRGIPLAQAELATLLRQNDGVQQQVAQAAQLRALPALPALSAPQRQQALEAATLALGPSGQIVVQGDRATLTVTHASPPAVQRWLETVQVGAQARPSTVDLQHSAEGWSGRVVLMLGTAP